MKSTIRSLMAVFFAVASLADARASDRDVTIADMMTDLQRLQVQMARGDRSAYAKSQDKLKAIGAAIAAAPEEAWKDKMQTDAAVAYVLSGGQPRVIARLLESGWIPDSEDNLMRGALAYSAGREREAEGLLGEIDARKLSLKLAGQLAYAQSVLKTSRDPERALDLLDLARLLAPGSLVEEAALRREILLAGDRRESERVVFLARQYVERFGQSIYAQDFILGLANNSVRFRLIDQVSDLDKFKSLMALATQEQRRAFLLSVARASIVAGRLDLAGPAAADGLAESPRGSPDEARGQMYVAASRISTESYETGVAELKAVDRARLSSADQNLLAAISSAAAHLRDTPSDSALADANREMHTAAMRAPISAKSVGTDRAGMTIELAERVLQDADSLSHDPKISP
jgi:chemotaxis protein MotC